jgi:hypothetical protein
MRKDRARKSRWRWRWQILAVAIVIAAAFVFFGTTHLFTVGALPVASEGVSSKSNVLIVDNCSNVGMTEPETIQLTCGDATTVASHLIWDEWGSNVAHGHGVVNEVSCNPNCADGQDKDYSIQIVLSLPVLAQSGDKYFTHIHLNFEESGPSGQTQDFMDCYANPPAPFLPRCPPT